jgi:hypothetical protein
VLGVWRVFEKRRITFMWGWWEWNVIIGMNISFVEGIGEVAMEDLVEEEELAFWWEEGGVESQTCGLSLARALTHERSLSEAERTDHQNPYAHKSYKHPARLRILPPRFHHPHNPP